jgi:2-iminobutanoate/2-iminopropanoate deaminase
MVPQPRTDGVNVTDHRATRKSVIKKCRLIIAILAVGATSLSAQIGASRAAPVPYRIARKFIYPPGLKAGEPFTPGVLAGDTLYVTGQVDTDPKTGRRPEGITAQARMAMDNVGSVLRAAGMDFGNVVSCHVHLVDMAQYAAMNEVYGSYLVPANYPARTTLGVSGLPGGANVEVTCIAYADKTKIVKVIPPAGANQPSAGPYSPAVWAGNTLYVSGNTGRDPKTNTPGATVEDQTRLTMTNIGKILSAAGLEQTDAVFTNVYYLDPNGSQKTYAKLNSVYKDFFPLGLAPSRASFCVSKLPSAGAVVEMTYIASRDHKTGGRVIPVYNRQNQTSSRGGVLDGGTLYTSGRSAPGDTVEKQLRDLMETIRDILRLAGMDLEHVVDTHIYLKDIAQAGAVNALMKDYFPKNPPARTIVQVNLDQLVQVQAVAVR